MASARSSPAVRSNLRVTPACFWSWLACKLWGCFSPWPKHKTCGRKRSEANAKDQRRIDLDSRFCSALSGGISWLCAAFYLAADLSSLHYPSRRLAVYRRTRHRFIRRDQRHLASRYRLLGGSLERHRRHDLGFVHANIRQSDLLYSLFRSNHARKWSSRHWLVRHEYRRLYLACDSGPGRPPR